MQSTTSSTRTLDRELTKRRLRLLFFFSFSFFSLSSMTNYMQFSLHWNTMTLSVCVPIHMCACVCQLLLFFFLLFFLFFSNETCCRVRGHTHRVKIQSFFPDYAVSFLPAAGRRNVRVRKKISSVVSSRSLTSSVWKPQTRTSQYV